MNYTIYKKGEDIAAFKYQSDALKFLESLREEELKERNSSILDIIAHENNLDRNKPGLFPMALSIPYYDRAREEIEKDIYMMKGYVE